MDIQGVPSDTGADITIMGVELFKKVASVAQLKKSAFKKPDKIPYTYDHQPFSLDGKLELDTIFDNHTMRTPVYVKIDAQELSEGVCHQLGIIKYHPSVDASPPSTIQSVPSDTHVPAVRVKLSVRIPPMKSTVVPVQLMGEKPARGLALVEPLPEDGFPQFASSFVKVDDCGRCNMLVTNPTGITQKLEPSVFKQVQTAVTVVGEGRCWRELRGLKGRMWWCWE